MSNNRPAKWTRKKYLLGSLPFQFTTFSDVAGQLLAADGTAWASISWKSIARRSRPSSPEEVLAVAKKYLRPKAVTIVADRPIDKDGKPLK